MFGGPAKQVCSAGFWKTKNKKLAGKSVSRILCSARPSIGLREAAIIPLGGALLRRSSSLPEGQNGPGQPSPPIWPCTTRGFPCLRCCHRSGGLLPHLFTLAKRARHKRLAGGFASCLSSRRCSQSAKADSPRFAPAVYSLWHYPWPGLVIRFRSPHKPSPLALPGALPNGVRTFLPLRRLAAAKPAIARPARQL